MVKPKLVESIEHAICRQRTPEEHKSVEQAEVIRWLKLRGAKDIGVPTMRKLLKERDSQID